MVYYIDDDENENIMTKKYCQCVLCGETIIADSQEECTAHMEVCQAFQNTHPEGKPTNPNAVYTNQHHNNHTTSSSSSSNNNSSRSNAYYDILQEGDNRETEEDNNRTSTKEIDTTTPTTTTTAYEDNSMCSEDDDKISNSVVVDQMSIKELKRFIRQAGLSDKDCIGGVDLQNRAKEAEFRTSLNPFN